MTDSSPPREPVASAAPERGRRCRTLLERPGAYVVQQMTYDAGTRHARHAHEDSSVFVVVRGRVEERAGPRTIECVEGGSGVIPAGAEHASVFAATTVRTVSVVFHEAWLSRTLGEDPGAAHPAYIPAGRAWARALALLAAPARARECGVLAADECVASLLVMHAPTSGERVRPEAPPAWIRGVTDLLRAANTPPALHEIADAVGRHPAHVCRAFRDAMGCSMSAYVQLARVERAAELLRRSNGGLAEVALASGFYDQSHFTREFRRVTGSTPRRFRESVR
ncbi:MAG: helix-turn-helix domain-containing protein [Planctomycetota bacterium]|nr:helix-turn-helix domain-containing protein [Planctomycetota bacterium]